MAKSTKKFEDKIEMLDEIIDKLERGEAPLDECISMYEKGINLAKECMVMLDEAEQKVKIISEEDSRASNE